MIGPSFMKLEDYKTVFSQFKDTAFSVALYNWGEPFLNKQIFDMIAHSSEHAVGTTVHSNFNVFNERMAVDAVQSGLTHIYLSIDGATQESYVKYRVKGDLVDVLDNLKLMTETKKRLKSRFPILTWKFLVFEHNRHEIESARRMAAEAGVDAFEVFNATPVLTDINDQAKAFLESNETHTQKALCRSLWSGIYVGPQGDVLPCSLAFRAEESFGNLLTQDISEVWNNKNYVNARKMFSEKIFENEIPVPCNGCKYKTICKRSGFVLPAELQNQEYQN
jgi:radical SAM protein with 4Fe4S-binding SPASM domain